MGGPAAEQLIAGVVLSERLAVTMYGAIHRAQFNGQRNLRGLVVDPRLLEDDSFRLSLTDGRNIEKITRLEHPNIVSTFAVESGGRDVVIVTRGVGRYVSVQDLITGAKAKSKQGKLSMPVAAQIGKSVIEALAAAHRAGVIHGAVHPGSVLVDEDGAVRLGDFIAGRALTTAVAQGADSSLWRGLAGYIAPELVVGEDPAATADVFAVGAMMFTMLTGEVPPGALRATPAVERLVQRALDTDPSRRYKTASDMLENLLEALEDDRWELAERGEMIREAGLSASDANIDDATEDLLASLGKSGMQVTAARTQVKDEPTRRPASDGGGLDALISNLGDDTGMTQVEEMPRRRDPISDIIRKNPRKDEAIVSASRVPSLDDDDSVPPMSAPAPNAGTGGTAQLRAQNDDELAALAAIGDLETPPGGTTNPTPPKRAQSEPKLEPSVKKSAPRAAPIVDPIRIDDEPPAKLKSPMRSLFGAVVVLGVIGGAGYMVYSKLQGDDARAEQARVEKEKREKEKQEIEAKLNAAQPDSGAIAINSTGAGIWMRLGRTPLVTPINLPAGQPHDLVLLHDGNAMTEAQVNGTNWTGAQKSLKAKLAVTLKPSKDKTPPVLPLQPTTPVLASTGVVGSGPVEIDSTPSDAEAWLFLGANQARFNELVAGRDYEFRVVKPGYKTQTVKFVADDWRDGGDPRMPIDAAKKKALLEKTVELEQDPDAKPGKAGKSGK